MRPVLVTGFAPFGGALTNASWEAAVRLPETLQGRRVEKLLLPVTYGGAGDVLEAALMRLRPCLAVCLGVAGSRRAITPETQAANLRRAQAADDQGQRYDGAVIAPAGPGALQTRLRLEGLLAAMEETGAPAALSQDAGTYVCNDVYYRLLRREAAAGCRGLFIHVPPETALPPEATARALAAGLSALLAQGQGSPWGEAGEVAWETDPARKRRIAREILEGLPEWFGIASSREAYIQRSGEWPMLTALDGPGGRPVGFLCLKQTSPAAAEVAVLGVEKASQRRGADRALLDAAQAYARQAGCRLLQVKTVVPGHDPAYDQTNRFYQALGFAPLETFPTYWDRANPCMVYVMALP